MTHTKWISDKFIDLGKAAGIVQYSKDHGALKTAHSHMQPLIGPEALNQLPEDADGIIDRDSFVEAFRDAYLDAYYQEHPEELI